jgi:hypothetical protein
MKTPPDGSHTFHVHDAAGFRLATITFNNYGANYAQQQALKVAKAIDGATSISRPEVEAESDNLEG